MTVPTLRDPTLRAAMPLAAILFITGLCQRPVEARVPPLAGLLEDQVDPLVPDLAMSLAGLRAHHLVPHSLRIPMSPLGGMTHVMRRRWRAR